MKLVLAIAVVLIGGIGAIILQSPLSPVQRADALLTAQPDERTDDAKPVRLRPTHSWANAYSLDSTLDGAPIPVGTVITAYTDDGILVGRTVVKVEGQYGVMALYMNDPSTSEVEGAIPGDTLQFRVDGLTGLVIGPDEPVWTENGALLELDLVAVSGL